MSFKTSKRLKLQATAVAAILAIGSTVATAATAVDENAVEKSAEPNAANDSSQTSWQETKRSAEEYWQEFRQDSEQSWESTQAAFRDGWIEGKLETAIVLNKHLNPFAIDIEVDNHTATLSGKVGTEAQKELATELAKGIEGIDSVNNTLETGANEEETANTNSNEKSGFSAFVDDAVLTADLKTDLMASDSVSALDINVDVNRAEVTLSGEVESEVEKDLAEKIVKNNPDVKAVNNQLKVKS